jgi:hypothetical protein
VVDGTSVFLPGGTNISYAAWPLHHSKILFGKDAEVFRPERWLLEKDDKKLAEINRTHELFFGYGKYQCLGKPIALMEIGKAAYEVSHTVLYPTEYICQVVRATSLVSNPLHHPSSLLRYERETKLTETALAPLRLVSLQARNAMEGTQLHGNIYAQRYVGDCNGTACGHLIRMGQGRGCR